MFRTAVVLAALTVLAAARQSPYAKEIQGLRSTNRFSDNILEDAQLDVPGLITKYGYPVEVHHVTTQDGYILEAHRIPYGRDRNNKPGKRPVAFVMHGLLSSSADFLVLGPGNALGYLLAEEGYDVWLGNARGNYYSRKHTTMDPDHRRDQDFWRFSWDEIGFFDIPAFVDHILNVTQQEKLHYIGHSQGGTVFLVLNSLRPQYNEKFISFQGLAPAAFFVNNEVTIFSMLAPYEKLIETAAFSLGMAEMFGSGGFLAWFRENQCSAEGPFTALCNSLLFSGETTSNLNQTMLPIIAGHSPAGSSIRQFAHYGQSIENGAFRRFNHSPVLNLIIYGSRSPPNYRLDRITVPSYLHYGMKDREVHFEDIVVLSKKLANTVGIFKVPRETFTHYDFIWAMDVKEQLYDLVVKKMREAEIRKDDIY